MMFCSRGHVALIGVALLIGIGLAPFASGLPDGYERVALDIGFHDAATESVTAASPLADYAHGPVSGIVGVALVVAAGAIVARFVRAGGSGRAARVRRA